MDIFDLSAVIRLDSSQYEQGLEDAKEKTNSFGSIVKNGVGTALKVGTAAFAAAGAAVTAFGASSVKTGAEFDKSMSQVAATMGTTVDQIQGLRDFAMDMGSKTAFSAVQAADALNYMALAGYDAEKSMAMLPNVLNLAAAGGMELARASDMITDAESALGLSTAEVNAMVDQMAKTASKSNTSVEQLGDAILTIGGTAQFMAGGTDRLNVALGILADNGIKGSEAGTKLRNMILKLSSPTKEGAEAIEALGLNIFDSSGKMRDFQDIIGDLNVAMADMTDEQKVQTISALFNARDIDAVQALLGTTTDRWNELGEAILAADGAAEAMANTQLDNLAGDITLFQSALEGAKILISDALTPSLRGLVQFGTEAITTLSDAFKEGGLSGAMEALGQLITQGLSNLIAALPSYLEAGVNLIASVVSGIASQLPALLSIGMETVANFATGILQNAPAAISAMGSDISQVIADIMQKLPEFLQKGIQIVGQIAQGLIQNAPAIINAMIQALVQLIATIASNLPQFLAKGIELIAQVASGIIQAIPQAVAAIPQVISGIVNAFTSFNWLSIGTNIISGIASGIRNAAGSVIDAIGGVASSAINGAKRLLGIASPSKVFRDQVGKMIAEGMALGISDGTPAVTDAVDDMNEDVFDTIDDIGYDKDVVVDKIGAEPDSGNGAVVMALQALTDAIYTLDDKLQEKMEEALETMHFDLNGREFGRLVRDVRI